LHLKNNSSVSSNRIIKNKKDLIETPVRYLNDAKVELYKTLPFGNNICKSTFDKYTKAERHINPMKLTGVMLYNTNEKIIRNIN